MAWISFGYYVLLKRHSMRGVEVSFEISIEPREASATLLEEDTHLLQEFECRYIHSSNSFRKPWARTTSAGNYLQNRVSPLTSAIA